MKVSVQNPDGSLRLLFEVDEIAVEDRQREERRATERAIIKEESGLTDADLDALGPTEYETIVNLVSMGFYRGLSRTDGAQSNQKVMFRLTDHSGKVKVHPEPEFRKPLLRSAMEAHVKKQVFATAVERFPPPFDPLQPTETTSPFESNAAEGPGLVVRVSGRATCPDCGKLYQHHPLNEEELSSIDGQPYLRVGCQGERLKL